MTKGEKVTLFCVMFVVALVLIVSKARSVEYNTDEGYNCDVNGYQMVFDARKQGWFVYDVEDDQRWLNLFNNMGEPSYVEGEDVFLLSPPQNLPYVHLFVVNADNCLYTYQGKVPLVGKGFIAKLMEIYNEQGI